ncbi:copper chaperone PCu(A)C [Actinotalea fermentans]|nr:copper chaperone PCu(A)C [Actinotalea fermentans]
MRRTTMIATSLLAALALGAGLAACGSGDDAGGGLAVTDAWVKATDEGMTGLFGTLVNETGEDVLVVAGTSAAAARVELHTTAMGEDGSMVMTPVEDGFTVPANGEHELAPGGDHIMLMELTAPLEPGDEVELTLETADVTTVDVVAVVRTFAGGQEEYEPADG